MRDRDYHGQCPVYREISLDCGRESVSVGDR